MASESTMNPEEQDDDAMLPMVKPVETSGADAVPVEDVDQAASARPGTTDVQAYIGRQLRAVYDDVVKQPIPDRFLALMKQLESGSRDS